MYFYASGVRQLRQSAQAGSRQRRSTYARKPVGLRRRTSIGAQHWRELQSVWHKQQWLSGHNVTRIKYPYTAHYSTPNYYPANIYGVSGPSPSYD